MAKKVEASGAEALAMIPLMILMLLFGAAVIAFVGFFLWGLVFG